VRDLEMECSDGVAREGAAEAAAYLEGYGIGCSGLRSHRNFPSLTHQLRFSRSDSAHSVNSQTCGKGRDFNFHTLTL